jgi:hypothetical protein
MRLSTVCTFALIALVCFIPADPAISQALTTSAPSATSAAATQTDGVRLNRVQAKLARAQALAARLADQAAALGYADNAWRYELINHLMKSDDASFAGVEATSDLASALRSASTAAASAAGAQPKSLGDTGDDLVYTPITPCRIVDTRNAGAGGAFTAAETRTYTYAGSAAQGGTACVPTTVVPEGLAVNVTIVSQGLGSASNSGFLSVFPQGGNAFAASWMNYYGNEILANAGVASINQSNGQFSVYAQNPTQVVVDVFGVLRPPQSGGTLNYLTKWTPNGNTLGTSSIFDNGNIGIGTNSPAYNLDIHGGNTAINLMGSGGATATISRYTNRLEIQPSDAFQIAIGAVASPNFYIANNGDIGMGNASPTNKLQIGSVGSTGFSANDIAFGNGTQASGIAQTATAGQWISTTNMALIPKNGAAAGDVGINTLTPTNKLQIGSVGSSGYGGNDIAFGNGAQVSGIAQTAGVAQWYSNTNIALMPLGTGHGRVGINTTSPSFPLDVEDYTTTAATNETGFAYQSTLVTGSYISPISIYAARGVMASEFDAISDARVKDIIGTSDSTRDLDTINALQITDYTMKDKVKNGDKPFKKVIAQQVETVYPQVVSKHTDFIPNVYAVASGLKKLDNGYLLRFKNAHHLSKDAKRLKLLGQGDGSMRGYAILGIPSNNEVIIDATELSGDNVFVYGEQVDDFRTVNYEGLAALNISATQELSKQLKQQQTAMATLTQDKDAQIAELRTRVAQLETVSRDVAELKAQLIAQRATSGIAHSRDVALQP